jgi:hypothetical protein
MVVMVTLRSYEYSWCIVFTVYARRRSFLVTLHWFISHSHFFLIFFSVCEEMLPEYYTKALLGSQVDQYIFNTLVANNLPEIDEHFQSVK